MQTKKDVVRPPGRDWVYSAGNGLCTRQGKGCVLGREWVVYSAGNGLVLEKKPRWLYNMEEKETGVHARNGTGGKTDE